MAIVKERAARFPVGKDPEVVTRDLGAMSTELWCYLFSSADASGSMTGRFVGWNGEFVSAPVTQAFTAANTNFLDIYHTLTGETDSLKLPNNFVGFRATTVSGTIQYNLGGQIDESGTITTRYTSVGSTRTLTASSTDDSTFGRINH